MTELPEDPEPSEEVLDVPDLPRDALVVRGGDPQAEGQLDRMLASAQASYDDGEGYALSTFVGWDPEKTRAELIADIARQAPLPQRSLAVTTVGEIIESGMTALLDSDKLPCHANIELGSNPDPDLVGRFIELFGPAEENPVHRELRKGRDAHRR